MQSDLRGGAFHRVHGAEKAVDIFRVGIGFEREQTFGDGLQVLFGFGNEKFEDFRGHFAILRQMIDKRVREAARRQRVLRPRLQRRRLREQRARRAGPETQTNIAA